jgi:hypothetical protein
VRPYMGDPESSVLDCSSKGTMTGSAMGAGSLSQGDRGWFEPTFQSLKNCCTVRAISPRGKGQGVPDPGSTPGTSTNWAFGRLVKTGSLANTLSEIE